jgi:hypothetical protein
MMHPPPPLPPGQKVQRVQNVKDLRVTHVQTGSTKRALDSDQTKYRLCLVFQFLPRPGLSSVVGQGKIAQDCIILFYNLSKCLFEKKETKANVFINNLKQGTV